MISKNMRFNMSSNRNLLVGNFALAGLSTLFATMLSVHAANALDKHMGTCIPRGSNTEVDTCIVDYVFQDALNNRKNIVFYRNEGKMLQEYNMITSDTDPFQGWDTLPTDTIVVRASPVTGKCVFWQNISRRNRNR